MTALACLAASFGCGPGPAPEPIVPVESFKIAYERSGGLKPLPQSLVVRPGRRAVATTLGPNGTKRTARFRVSVLTVKTLRNALRGSRWDTLSTVTDPSGCADCYLYSITYQGHSVHLLQNQVPEWLANRPACPSS